MNDKTRPYLQSPAPDMPPLSAEEFQREQMQSRIDELRDIIESRDIIIENLRSTVSQLRAEAKQAEDAVEPVCMSIAILDGVGDDVKGLYAFDQVIRSLDLQPDGVRRIIRFLEG